MYRQNTGAAKELFDVLSPLTAYGLVGAIGQVRIVEQNVPANMAQYAKLMGGENGTHHPKAFALSATAVPIRPSPRMPKVAPRDLAMSGCSTGQ